MNWIEKIVPSIGLLIGIVFVAIGATMGFGSLIKISTYEAGSYDSYICQNKPIVEGVEDTMDNGDLEECISREKENAKSRYMQDKKENVIDGLVFLIVGIVFWRIFAKKK